MADSIGFLDTALDCVEDILKKVIQDTLVSNNLSYLKGFDGYTFDHSLRVSALSGLCGITLGLSDRELKDICTGALLHDLGKTCLSKAVLDKPDKLSFNEFQHIKLHSQFGFDLLAEKGVKEEIAKIALHHHERFDGSGYPLGLRGEEINQFAKVVAIADTFEALTADRVYRRAFSTEESVEIIKQLERTQFDPEIPRVFKAVLGEKPTQTYRKLLERF